MHHWRFKIHVIASKVQSDIPLANISDYVYITAFHLQQSWLELWDAIEYTTAEGLAIQCSSLLL